MNKEGGRGVPMVANNLLGSMKNSMKNNVLSCGPGFFQVPAHCSPTGWWQVYIHIWDTNSYKYCIFMIRVYLYVHPSTCCPFGPSLSQSVCQSICLSINQPIHPSVHPSVFRPFIRRPSIRPCPSIVLQSVCRYVYPSACPFLPYVRPYVYMSVKLSVCKFDHLHSTT